MTSFKGYANDVENDPKYARIKYLMHETISF